MKSLWIPLRVSLALTLFAFLSMSVQAQSTNQLDADSNAIGTVDSQRVVLSLDGNDTDRTASPSTAANVDNPFVSLHPSNPGVPSVIYAESAPSRGFIELVVDDGEAENSIGVGGAQFLWLNRFTPSGADFPFKLEQIEVLFPGSTGVEIGQIVEFYVYEDDDNDPSNGAFFVGSLPTQQIMSLDEFWTYDVDIDIEGLGDVLIAVVMRTETGAAHFPAAIDETATQARSWAGFGAGTEDNPPIFPLESFGLIDGFGFPGNWLIRGYGTLISSTDGDGEGTTFDLFQNYPNPFAGETRVSFALPVASHVTIEVLDVTGRRVALLVDDYLGADTHEVTWNANGIASGVYFYRMQADGFSKTLRTTLVQ